MKVLDLICAHSHEFEGWFGSEADFQSQCDSGLIECPVCGVHGVEKRLSAPRLNLKNPRPPEAAAPPGEASPPRSPPVPAQVQAAVLAAMRTMVAQSEDVGDRFAHEALRMHHGEIAEKHIRGRATRDQAMELMEEGVPVMPLPDFLKEPLQ